VLGKAQVPQDLADDGRVSEEDDDAHLSMAGRAPQRIHLIDPGQEAGPSGAGRGCAVGAGGAGRRARGYRLGVLSSLASEAHDVASPG
jgi:hypothetical protein